MLAVDVRSDVHSDHTTIAVRMPGFTNKEDAEYMRRHVEYELHKMQARMQGALMGRVDAMGRNEGMSAMQTLDMAKMQEMQRAMMMQQNSNVMAQANALSPYGNNMLGQLSQGPINQAIQAQAARAQSAQPKRLKTKTRKKLLLCEVTNAVRD